MIRKKKGGENKNARIETETLKECCKVSKCEVLVITSQIVQTDEGEKDSCRDLAVSLLSSATIFNGVFTHSFIHSFAHSFIYSALVGRWSVAIRTSLGISLDDLVLPEFTYLLWIGRTLIVKSISDSCL